MGEDKSQTGRRPSAAYRLGRALSSFLFPLVFFFLLGGPYAAFLMIRAGDWVGVVGAFLLSSLATLAVVGVYYLIRRPATTFRDSFFRWWVAFVGALLFALLIGSHFWFPGRFL